MMQTLYDFLKRDISNVGINVFIVSETVAGSYITPLTRHDEVLHMATTPDSELDQRKQALPNQFDNATKQEVIDFFDNTNDINEIMSYCEQNRMNCFYYCTDINSEHEVCDNIMIPNNGGPPGGFGNRG